MKSSIIIPTLNRQKDLNNCLNSILNNSVKPDEIILIEQWNLKKTKNIIENFKWKLNIKLLFSDIKSWSIARNKWINKANWEYLFFIDDDTTFDYNFIEYATSYLNKNKEVMWITWKDMMTQVKPNIFWMIVGFIFNISTIKESWKILNSWHNTIIYYSNKVENIEAIPWCCMILRKKSLSNSKFNHNFIKRSFWEDMEFSYKIYKKYWKWSLKYLPKLKFYHHKSVISRLKNDSLIKMKIIYRYIFWKNEVYNNKSINLICYIWSQIWLLLLEIFYKKNFNHIQISFKSYNFLIKNYKKIDNNNIDYNKFIIN